MDGNAYGTVWLSVWLDMQRDLCVQLVVCLWTGFAPGQAVDAVCIVEATWCQEAS